MGVAHQTKEPSPELWEQLVPNQDGRQTRRSLFVRLQVLSTAEDKRAGAT